MVFNATFNNISVTSWRLVLLVEENGVPGKNNRSVASHLHTLSHNVVSSTPRHPIISTVIPLNFHTIYFMSIISSVLLNFMIISFFMHV